MGPLRCLRSHPYTPYWQSIWSKFDQNLFCIRSHQMRQDVCVLGWEWLAWLDINFFTSTWRLWLDFSTCPLMALWLRGLLLFLERFSSAQDVSLSVCFPSRSSCFCFLSVLFFVAFIFLPLALFGLQISDLSPFRTGAYEVLDFFWPERHLQWEEQWHGVLCLSTDSFCSAY